MLVPTPLLVDALIRKVKRGKLVTVTQIMKRLAKDFHADSTCPMTTGIFIRIASETAEEDQRAGIQMGKGKKPPRVKDFEKFLQKL